jgi:hypothetical protein
MSFGIGGCIAYCTIADQDQCPRGTASLSLRLFDSCVGRLVVFAFAFLASSSVVSEQIA